MTDKNNNKETQDPVYRDRDGNVVEVQVLPAFDELPESEVFHQFGFSCKQHYETFCNMNGLEKRITRT